MVMPRLPDEHQNEQVRRRDPRRAVNQEPRARGVKLVLRLAREPPVQPGVDEHEHVKAKHRPVPDSRIVVGGKPQEHGEERNMDEYEGAASRRVRHRAQDK